MHTRRRMRTKRRRRRRCSRRKKTIDGIKAVRLPPARETPFLACTCAISRTSVCRLPLPLPAPSPSSPHHRPLAAPSPPRPPCDLSKKTRKAKPTKNKAGNAMCVYLVLIQLARAKANDTKPVSFMLVVVVTAVAVGVVCVWSLGASTYRKSQASR